MTMMPFVMRTWQAGQSESSRPGFQLIVMNVSKIQELTMAGGTWLC